MANTKSAKKRIQVAERNRILNRSYKSTIRTLIKKCLEISESYVKEPSDEIKLTLQSSIDAAYSKIDKAVKKNVIHKNTAANQKSRINKAAKEVLAK